VLFRWPCGTALRPRWCASTLGPDALQKDACGLVVRVLRHKFASERLGENSLVEMIDQLAGAGSLGG
jgi:hypothetical protein